jgi:catechol 2,3-dioxygenase-like lactoylglutathione lyase family enzyme
MDETKILGGVDAMANIAVKDLAVGRQFYAETLGLTQVDSEGDEAITFSSGASTVIVYRSEFAGTNKATSMTWDVGTADIEKVVQGLKGKGVKFERYDIPNGQHEGDLHVFGPMKVTWFKDPDGNILSLFSQSGSR